MGGPDDLSDHRLGPYTDHRGDEEELTPEQVAEVEAARVMAGIAAEKEDYDLYEVLETLFAPPRPNLDEVDWKQYLKTSLKKVRESIV